MILEYKGYDLTVYMNFISECKQKDYTNQETHVHHIIPKFMCGTNDVENLIILSYEDHKIAHIKLAECFPEISIWYKGNICAANFVQKWIESSDCDLRIKLSKAMKGRIPSVESITLGIETKRKNGTLYASSETKQKMSNTRKQKAKTGEIIPWNKGLTIFDDPRISKLGTSRPGVLNPMFGKTHSEKSIQLMRENLKGTRTGNKNPMFGKSHEQHVKDRLSECNGRKIIHIFTGKEFTSIPKAAAFFNKTIIQIRRLLSKGEFIDYSTNINTEYLCFLRQLYDIHSTLQKFQLKNKLATRIDV